MKLKTIAAASVVALTALSSHAASTDWSSHGLLEVGWNTATSAPVFDTYSFTLGGQSTVESSVVTFGALVGGAYSLYSYGTDGMFGTADDVGVGAWTTNGVHNTVTLDAGSYYYTVLGGALGTASYVISSAATAAPVPEPETYALLGAGLGIVGFVASRRRRDY
jgi:hypothetical protein